MYETLKWESGNATARGSGSMSSAMPERLNSLDDLLQAAHELLLDTRLEVGGITPLLYSLLETFIENFQSYPYDDVNNLLIQLEREGYPEHEMRELLERIENAYKQHHCTAVPHTTPVLATDDEVEGLRQGIKYAAMAAEQDYREGCANQYAVRQLPGWITVRKDMS